MKSVPDGTGQFVGLEVKTVIGRLSPNRDEFGKGVTIVGGVYAVGGSIDDVVKLGM